MMLCLFQHFILEIIKYILEFFCFLLEKESKLIVKYILQFFCLLE